MDPNARTSFADNFEKNFEKRQKQQAERKRQTQQQIDSSRTQSRAQATSKAPVDYVNRFVMRVCLLCWKKLVFTLYFPKFTHHTFSFHITFPVYFSFRIPVGSP